MNGVSVYIPFKDSDESLREVLPAVAAQDYPINELILVDDGSKNPLAVTLPDRIPTRVVSHARNLGVAAARNTALKEVRSDLVVSFDADIVPARDCISQLVAELQADPTHVGVGSKVTERYHEARGDLFRAHYMKQDQGEERKVNVDLFGGCTLYKRSALFDVGGYTETLRNSFEDFDIARRVRERGGKTIYLPTARAEHIKRDSVISAVDTLYRWSYPHWESNDRLARHNWLAERLDYPQDYYERAVSSRLETLDFKIRSDLTLAYERVQTCTEQRLFYPLLLYPIRSTIRDLINYRNCQGQYAVELSHIFADLLVCLLVSTIPEPLAPQIQQDIRDLIDDLYGESRWQEYLAASQGNINDLLNSLAEKEPISLPAQTFLELYAPVLSTLATQLTKLP